MYPSVFFVVLDRIFYKICDHKCNLYLIDLRCHRTEAFKYQLNIAFCRKRLKPFEDPLYQFIDIPAFDIQICPFLVQFYQIKKIIDDLILPLDLFRQIPHKFPVKLCRCIRLHQQGICQYLHGCQRCLQLMGYICHELFSRCIQYFITVPQLIKCIGNPFRFIVSIFMEIIISIASCHLLDRLRHPFQRPYKQHTDDC